MSPGDVATTIGLQRRCVAAYLSVASALQVGMSEKDIASALQHQMNDMGISDYWYDVPIITLIGRERFQSIAQQGYTVKAPQADIRLCEGQVFFVDLHPRHASGRWGNFAATGWFGAPDSNQVSFLRLMQTVQEEGIRSLSCGMSGTDIYAWFRRKFDQHRIECIDVRGNFGHTMGAGSKYDYRRLFLDEHCEERLGGTILGIEPGGMSRVSGEVVVARFEDCVYLSPDGPPIILGRDKPLPVVFNGE
ncbi:MAG TPA: M24 family metallopeptidase [Ktedonobacteraceae bacterium]